MAEERDGRGAGGQEDRSDAPDVEHDADSLPSGQPAIPPSPVIIRTRPDLGPEPPLNWRRGFIVGAALISLVLVILIVIALVLTGTDWGRERVRVRAEAWANTMVHGHVHIGRLTGNLLVGMTVHDFTITDSAGRPFVALESFTGDYSIASLARKRIWVKNVIVVRPLVFVHKPPNDAWNWQHIFPRDTTPKPPSQQLQWGDWIRFSNAQVVDGQLVVRTPWHPSEHLKPPAQDSAIREVLSGRSRLVVERVPGGFEKLVTLKSVTAHLPLLRLSEPGYSWRLAEVTSLRMIAYPFREPGAVVNNIIGAFPFNNDSAWWHNVYGELPHSKMSGSGVFTFNTGDLTLNLHGGPASFADLRWVYPRFPSDGGGTFDLAVKWRGAAQDYLAQNADVTMNGAHILGSLGLMLTDTVAIHDANLRFTSLDTRTLEQLIPHFTSPRRGLLAGRVIANGGPHAMVVNGDVEFADQRDGVSRVAAVGEMGILETGGLQARNLRVSMRPAQVELARKYMPKLPVSGQVSGTVIVNGSTNSQLAVNGDIEHVDRGNRSAINGRATIHLAGDRRIDVNVNAHPLSLAEVGRFFPAAGLQGTATGPIRAIGTLNDLLVNADVALPDHGRLVAEGTFDIAAPATRYDVTARMYTLNLRSVLANAPVTSLSARAMARGSGTDFATMRATLAADMSRSSYDTLSVDSASVRATVADGLATLERLDVRMPHLIAQGNGGFGLTRARTGTLTYTLTIDSLGAYNRFVPRTARDTGAAAPRPGITATAVRRAKEDSARVARATEVVRAISGAPGPKLSVRVPPSVRRDTVGGSLHAAGTLRGNLFDFDLRGRAGGENLTVRGNYVRRFLSDYAWTGARTDHSTLAVGVDADSVGLMGFWFDTAAVRLSYAAPGGHAEVLVRQDPKREYVARGDFTLHPDDKSVRLANLTLRLDTAVWAAPHAATVAWGGPGIRVTDFELRNRGNGRLFANGLLPTNGTADFVFDVDNLPLGNISDLLQSTTTLTGLGTIHGAMTGTMANPSFRGAFGVLGGTYNDAVLPELRGRFNYANLELTTHVDAVRQGGQPMAVVDGTIPINLALSGVTGDRLLPNEMNVNLVSDSLPLELIPSFTDLVSNTHGRAVANIAMRGTLRRPSLRGALFVSQGAVTINITGQTVDNLTASVRMLNDTVYVDSVVGQSVGPVRLRGNLAIGNWREPAMNLFFTGKNAEVLNNQHGRLRADFGLALTGPFRSAYTSGQVNILQGVIRAPEPLGRHVINQGDPGLFNVLDTSIVAERDLFPARSPLLANMRVEVAFNVNRNTWVRNREANVEIYTDFPMTVRAEHEALALTGVITTERGEYKFMSKRFAVKRGSAIFIGSADLNPTLQVTGEYQVQAATSRVLNIRVIVAGTLRKPRLSLESDAQPPRTQSELLSLLAFGEPTSSLFNLNGSSVAGTAAGDLFGYGAQLAVKRLSGIAMGVMVDEVETETSKALGADMVNITPASVPTELIQGRGIGNFLSQTRLEVGKYVNPRTFVTGQELGGKFGAGIQNRAGEGWQFSASFEPRLLLREPTLSGPQPFWTRVYGGFIIREWRF